MEQSETVNGAAGDIDGAAGDIDGAAVIDSTAGADGAPTEQSEFDSAVSAAFAAMAATDPAEHGFDELQYIGGLADVEGAYNKYAEKDVLPFNKAHEPPQDFKSVSRHCFIPLHPVRVKVTGFERTSTSHLLNPYLYTIECEHGPFRWTIRRRYKHFSSLHKSLRLFRTAMRLPFPTKYHKIRRQTHQTQAAEHQPLMPRMPKRGDSMLTEDELPERMKQLEDYINAVIKSKLYRNHHDTLEFLEVSQWSFVHELGIKGKEGLVKKRIGSAQSNEGPKYCGLCFQCRKCAAGYCAGWRRRWLMVKDTYIAYVRPRDGRVHSVMLMDSDWDVNRGIYGVDTSHSLTIVNSSRNLQVNCWTKRKAKEWLEALKYSYQNYGKVFVEGNRYESFAPLRESSCRSRWYVDGSEYFRDVADTIEAAREQVFITDWWLSPEIFLKRPAGDSAYWRLDKLLLRKAAAGVKVYVMLYKEVEMALGINSFYSKQKLMTHENIKVIRHPDHASSAVLFWAHHEKLVVVDQSYAFVGGIDLCYGRWDDFFHRLVDSGGTENGGNGACFKSAVTSSTPAGGNIPSTLLALAQGTNVMTIGAVAGTQQKKSKTNVKIMDSGALPQIIDAAAAGVSEDVVDVAPQNGHGPPEAAEDADQGDDERVQLKGETPPMPRRRLIRSMIRARQAASTWSHDMAGRSKRHLRHSDVAENGGVENGGGDHVTGDVDHPDGTHKPIEMSSEPAASAAVDDTDSNRCKVIKSKLWIGKDYANFIVKDFGVLDAFQDQVDRSCVPRMPWHDIATGVVGSAARDVARHFIQRWNAVKVEKLRYNLDYDYLLPKSYQTCESIPEVLSSPCYKTKCQIVRSASQWSVGGTDTEDSIQQAYVDMISRAKHYIYMENQFFVSLCGINADVHNQICEALFQRILRAHNQGALFRVYVVIPLLPGFEGQVGTAGGTAIQAITHWNYSSICRGNHSLLGRLKDRGVADPLQYVTFHGLRTHATLAGRPVTELIYVHSKLMIVDDNSVICGSANINDRSMMGNRDSEVCMVVEDIEFEEGVMAGEKVQVGRYAGGLRRHLFSEHLGLLERPDPSVSIDDPVSDAFYHGVWKQWADLNTQLYEKVFKCIPTDEVTTFAQLQQYQTEVPLALSFPGRAAEMLTEIRGFVVNLPLSFLEGEDLTPDLGTKEALVPTYMWT